MVMHQFPMPLPVFPLVESSEMASIMSILHLKVTPEVLLLFQTIMCWFTLNADNLDMTEILLLGILQLDCLYLSNLYVNDNCLN